MTRTKAKGTSKQDSSLESALELVERLYNEGKLQLLTAEQRRNLLDETIADADAFTRPHVQDRIKKNENALAH